MAECSTCPANEDCSRDQDKCMVLNNPLNKVKKIIGIMSGKGGVGKSSISVLIASHLKQLGYKVGILDADITGPTVPRLLNISDQRIKASDQLMLPIRSVDGIEVMSLNFLINKEEDPVIWRGPMISVVVKQFWTQVLWGELDYLIIDMPPGTSDVALTVMQSIPINGMIIISVPQELVSMIVSKTVNMARRMDVNVLGVIENMGYISCPDCGKKMRIFYGESIEEFIKTNDLKLLGELPMLDSISNLSKNRYHNISDNVKTIIGQIVNNIIQSLK